MEIRSFLARYALFTSEELDAYLREKRPSSAETHKLAQVRKSLLVYHKKEGHLIQVRRGLWATVPAHREPDQQPVDGFLIASKLTRDAIIAYHGALALHGLAHSLREEIVVLSGQSFVNPLRFRGGLYRAVPPPRELPLPDALSLGVETWDRQGVGIRVTGQERTVVDCLDRPLLSGGWEEVWHSLEGLDAYLDFDLLIDYTLKLRTATTAAKVGYFLSLNQERLRVPDQVLETLRARRPKRAHYVLRDRVVGQAAGASRFVSEWNLMVPLPTGEDAYE